LPFYISGIAYPIDKGDTVIVSQYNVNIYKHPNERSEILVKPFRGDKVKVIDKTKGKKENLNAPIDGHWYLIKTNSGIKGWIFRSYLYMVSQNEEQLLEKLKSSAKEWKGNAIFQLGLIKSSTATDTFRYVRKYHQSKL
jgi:uncharacterized protein YgiM (DUF1202 family)